MHKLDDNLIDFFNKKSIRVLHEILWARGVEQINSVLRDIYNNDLQNNITTLILIFIVDDYVHHITSYTNQIIIRTSLYRSQILKNELVLPYIWEYSSLPFEPLPKTNMPIVGFCGLASTYRKTLIEKIKNNKNIQDNFIERQHFWGGNPHGKQIVDEFNDNIQNSHFVICNRGAGNFSMRLYQTLAFGRIPLLLNTDIILPFEKYINYNELFIIGNTEDEIIEKLLDCWENKDIVLMQKQCADIFREFFSTDKFSIYLYNEILYKRNNV